MILRFSKQLLAASALALLQTDLAHAQSNPPPYSGEFNSGAYSLSWQHIETDDTLYFEVTTPINSWAAVGFSNNPNTGHGAVDSIVCFSTDGVQGTVLSGNAVPSGDKTQHRLDSVPSAGLAGFEVNGDTQTCKFTRPRAARGEENVDLVKPEPGFTVTQYLVWAWGNDIPGGCDAVVCAETNPNLIREFPFKYASHGQGKRGSERVTFFDVEGATTGGGSIIDQFAQLGIVPIVGGVVGLFFVVLGTLVAWKKLSGGSKRSPRANPSPRQRPPGQGGRQQFGERYHQQQKLAAYNPQFVG